MTLPHPTDDEAGVEVPAAVDAVGRRVLGAAIRVHRALGPGGLESTYRLCLGHALRRDGLRVQTEVWVPIEFEGMLVERALRVDLIVEDCVLVELKAVESLHPAHEAQVISYLRFTGLSLGYLLNFHAPRMSAGMKRFAMSHPPR